MSVDTSLCMESSGSNSSGTYLGNSLKLVYISHLMIALHDITNSERQPGAQLRDPDKETELVSQRENKTECEDTRPRKSEIVI